MNRKVIVVFLLSIMSLFITGCDKNETVIEESSVYVNENSESETSEQPMNDTSLQIETDTDKIPSTIDSQSPDVVTQKEGETKTKKYYSFNPTCYELNSENEFIFSDDNKVDSFVYGKNCLGDFSINGAFVKETT